MLRCVTYILTKRDILICHFATHQTSWDAAQRQGSKGIFVWESTDLVNWVNERLVAVEDNTAGMVWAPEAIWDPDKGQFVLSTLYDVRTNWILEQYLAYWASKFVGALQFAGIGVLDILFANLMQSTLPPILDTRVLLARSRFDMHTQATSNHSVLQRPTSTIHQQTSLT